MLIVAFGVPRSASTFTFQLLDELIHQDSANTGRSVIYPFGEKRFESVYAETPAQLTVLIQSGRGQGGSELCLVKTHVFPNMEVRGLAHVVPVINARIPVPAACSIIETHREQIAARGESEFPAGASIDAACAEIYHAQQYEQQWRQHPRAIVVRYSEILDNKRHVCDRLIEHLGLTADATAALAKFEKPGAIWQHRETKTVRLEEGEIALVREYFALRRRLMPA